MNINPVKANPGSSTWATSPETQAVQKAVALLGLLSRCGVPQVVGVDPFNSVVQALGRFIGFTQISFQEPAQALSMDAEEFLGG